MTVGATQQFTANVENAIDSSVSWSVSGTGCSGSTCGTITSGGLYTPPRVVPSPPSVTITATSVEDTAQSDTADATLIPSEATKRWPNAAQAASLIFLKLAHASVSQ